MKSNFFLFIQMCIYTPLVRKYSFTFIDAEILTTMTNCDTSKTERKIYFPPTHTL